MYFPHLPETSKVWIYQSQTEITEELQVRLLPKLKTFIQGWAAHGNGLFGDATILENYFIVLAVDESKVPASGCSIDTSVHFIRHIGQEFNLDFFNRLNVLIELDGDKKIINYHDLKSFPGALFFNPMITKLKELRGEWRKVI